jgi:hypothetical protein
LPLTTASALFLSIPDLEEKGIAAERLFPDHLPAAREATIK